MNLLCQDHIQKQITQVCFSPSCKIKFICQLCQSHKCQEIYIKNVEDLLKWIDSNFLTISKKSEMNCTILSRLSNQFSNLQQQIKQQYSLYSNKFAGLTSVSQAQEIFETMMTLNNLEIKLEQLCQHFQHQLAEYSTQIEQLKLQNSDIQKQNQDSQKLVNQKINHHSFKLKNLTSKQQQLYQKSRDKTTVSNNAIIKNSDKQQNSNREGNIDNQTDASESMQQITQLINYYNESKILNNEKENKISIHYVLTQQDKLSRTINESIVDQQLSQLQKEFTEVNNKYRTLEQRYDTINKNNIRLLKLLDDENNKNKTLQLQLQDINEKNQLAQKELKNEKKQNESLQSQLADIQQMKAALKELNDESQKGKIQQQQLSDNNQLKYKLLEDLTNEKLKKDGNKKNQELLLESKQQKNNKQSLEEKIKFQLETAQITNASLLQENSTIKEEFTQIQFELQTQKNQNITLLKNQNLTIQEKNEKDTENNKLRRHIECLEKEKKQLQQTIDNLKQQYSETFTQYTRLKISNDNLQRQHQTCVTQYKYDTLNELKNKFQKQIEEIQKKIEYLQQMKEKDEQELRELKRRNDQFDSQVQRYNQQYYQPYQYEPPQRYQYYPPIPQYYPPIPQYYPDQYRYPQQQPNVTYNYMQVNHYHYHN